MKGMQQCKFLGEKAAILKFGSDLEKNWNINVFRPKMPEKKSTALLSNSNMMAILNFCHHQAKLKFSRFSFKKIVKQNIAKIKKNGFAWTFFSLNPNCSLNDHLNDRKTYS